MGFWGKLWQGVKKGAKYAYSTISAAAPIISALGGKKGKMISAGINVANELYKPEQTQLGDWIQDFERGKGITPLEQASEKVLGFSPYEEYQKYLPDALKGKNVADKLFSPEYSGYGRYAYHNNGGGAGTVQHSPKVTGISNKVPSYVSPGRRVSPNKTILFNKDNETAANYVNTRRLRK